MRLVPIGLELFFGDLVSFSHFLQPANVDVLVFQNPPGRCFHVKNAQKKVRFGDLLLPGPRGYFAGALKNPLERRLKVVAIQGDRTGCSLGPAADTEHDRFLDPTRRQPLLVNAIFRSPSSLGQQGQQQVTGGGCLVAQGLRFALKQGKNASASSRERFDTNRANLVVVERLDGYDRLDRVLNLPAPVVQADAHAVKQFPDRLGNVLQRAQKENSFGDALQVVATGPFFGRAEHGRGAGVETILRQIGRRQSPGSMRGTF